MTLERALERRARGEYREALRELRGAADDVEVLLELSRLHEDLGDYDEAARVARRTVELAAGTALAPLALSRKAATERAQRRPHDAEGTAVQAESLARRGGDESALAEALVELGTTRLELARLDDADAAFHEAHPPA